MGVYMCVEMDVSSVQQEQLSNEDSSSSYSVSEPATKKKKVKRVSWVDESKLCSYFYFQLDEAERGQYQLLLHQSLITCHWLYNLYTVKLCYNGLAYNVSSVIAYTSSRSRQFFIQNMSVSMYLDVMYSRSLRTDFWTQTLQQTQASTYVHPPSRRLHS